MESIGFLQVAVKTANGALPVENARVNIYEYYQGEERNNGSNIIYSLITDESGNTPKVALKTKNKELSMSPGNEYPFSSYNIFVSSDGYYNSSYINVPVFQGITAIQPVNLIPLIEYAEPTDDYPSSQRRFLETPNTNL